jgi:hypothetical protein
MQVLGKLKTLTIILGFLAMIGCWRFQRWPPPDRQPSSH